MNKKEFDKMLDKNLGELEISNDSQNINKKDLLVSYDFNSFYPGAHIDINSTWLWIETAYPLLKDMNESICNLFNTGRWN